MFCPYCAAESTQGLNYCNRCGGNLSPFMLAAAQESRPAVASPGLAWAAGLTTGAVVVFGLFLIFPITSELAIRGVHSAALVWISLFVALTALGCAAMLLRFWSLLLGVGGRAQGPAQLQPGRPDTRELDARRFESLNSASAPSVTEQTTRTLERAKK